MRMSDDPALREALAALDRVGAPPPRPLLQFFIERGERVVPRLVELVQDETRPLPQREGAVRILGALQFEGGSDEDLAQRDRSQFVALMIALLRHRRQEMRVAATYELVGFSRRNRQRREPYVVDEAAIDTALARAQSARKLPHATSAFVDEWRAGYDGPWDW
jgi:hypothetical protein